MPDEEVPVVAKPSQRVRNEWLRRVEAEYHSAAITQHFTLWLIQIGAPPELISDGLAIVADEMNHARLSFDVFAQAGGTQAPILARETLQLARSNAPLEHDIFLCNLQTFVLGETVAVRLFKRLREVCTVPVARTALDTILVDEVRHREFGWTVLEWMLSTPMESEYRKLTGTVLASMIAKLQENYGGTADDGTSKNADAVHSPADADWGLLPRASYQEATSYCLEVDYRPRFAALGITI